MRGGEGRRKGRGNSVNIYLLPERQGGKRRKRKGDGRVALDLHFVYNTYPWKKEKGLAFLVCTTHLKFRGKEGKEEKEKKEKKESLNSQP